MHTHSLFSDGVLLPFELIRRAEEKGCEAIAITDHVDPSNVEFAVRGIVRAVKEIEGRTSLKVIAGAEVTHVPPDMIKSFIEAVRGLGAAIVVVHGETIVEPVAEGTNHAAIMAGADILAHPGLISPEDALLAREKGTAFEITSRNGHCLSNGHVARQAEASGARLVVNTDTHGPSDLITHAEAVKVLLSAGVPEDALKQVFETSREIFEKAFLRRSNA